jgi:hypothetical protein
MDWTKFSVYADVDDIAIHKEFCAGMKLTLPGEANPGGAGLSMLSMNPDDVAQRTAKLIEDEVIEYMKQKPEEKSEEEMEKIRNELEEELQKYYGQYEDIPPLVPLKPKLGKQKSNLKNYQVKLKPKKKIEFSDYFGMVRNNKPYRIK